MIESGEILEGLKGLSHVCGIMIAMCGRSAIMFGGNSEGSVMLLLTLDNN